MSESYYWDLLVFVVHNPLRTLLLFTTHWARAVWLRLLGIVHFALSVQYRSPTNAEFHFAYQDSLTEVRFNLSDNTLFRGHLLYVERNTLFLEATFSRVKICFTLEQVIHESINFVTALILAHKNKYMFNVDPLDVFFIGKYHSNCLCLRIIGHLSGEQVDREQKAVELS